MRLRVLLAVLLDSILVISYAQAARPQCTAQTCVTAGDLSRRSWLGEAHTNLSLLTSRALVDVPETGISAYVQKAVNNLPAGNKIYNDGSEVEPSTSLFRAFITPGQPSSNPPTWVPSFNLGLKMLTGCTSVIIISGHAVYTTHFYEDTAMVPGLNTYAATLLTGGSSNGFESVQSHIIDLSSSPYGPAFPFPQVYIINPIKSAEEPVDADQSPLDTRPAKVIGWVEDTAQYSQAIGDIKSELEKVWPGINTIQDVRYYPLNIGNRRQADVPAGIQATSDRTHLIKTSAGRILFEYDLDPKGPRAVRLWSESIRLIETTLPT